MNKFNVGDKVRMNHQHATKEVYTITGTETNIYNVKNEHGNDFTSSGKFLIKAEDAPISTFKDLAYDVATLLEEKNKAYGNSHLKTGEIFRILYPDGIKPDQYTDILTLARMFDKFFRIATGNEAFQQEDARKDVVGYAMLLARRDK